MTPTQGTVISADAVLFSELFHKGRFIVPWHQRYYDWEKKDIQALLDDIDEAVKADRRCYFLGALILVGVEDGKWEINDGQQRMVTVSLICAALCRRFAQETQDSQREGIALRMLFDLSSTGVCQLERAEHYSPRIEPPLSDQTRYNQLIRGHMIGTNGKLTTAWRVIDKFFGPTNVGRHWEKYFDYISGRLEVACLTVPLEIDPNAVFETINCRGEPLNNLDLIRNFIYSHFNAEAEAQRKHTVHNNLERIREVFPTVKKAEEYVRCQMHCRFGFLPKNTFYRDARQAIREQRNHRPPRRNPSDFAFDLVREIARREELELFRRLTAPTSHAEFVQDFESKSGTTASPRNLTIFLRELKPYSVTHMLIFALMVKYIHETDGRRKRRIARLVNRNLSRLASFVLRTALVSPFEPSHFEKEFANFARWMTARESVPDKEFADFLRTCDRDEYNVLDDDKFRDSMSEVEIRAHGNTAKIRSLLLGINRLGHPDAVILSDMQCSIEHVLPTSEEHWDGWDGFRKVDPNGWIHRVGNLTLTSRLDNKPGRKYNGSFARKRPIYRNSSIAITRDIAKYEAWTPDKIKLRQRKIADLARRVWVFT